MLADDKAAAYVGNLKEIYSHVSHICESSRPPPLRGKAVRRMGE